MVAEVLNKLKNNKRLAKEEITYMVDNYMKRNKDLTLDSLLRNNDHQPIIKANKG